MNSRVLQTLSFLVGAVGAVSTALQAWFAYLALPKQSVPSVLGVAEFVRLPWALALFLAFIGFSTFFRVRTKRQSEFLAGLEPPIPIPAEAHCRRQELQLLIESHAMSRAQLHICGESGTGKSWFSRYELLPALNQTGQACIYVPLVNQDWSAGLETSIRNELDSFLRKTGARQLPNEKRLSVLIPAFRRIFGRSPTIILDQFDEYVFDHSAQLFSKGQIISQNELFAKNRTWSDIAALVRNGDARLILVATGSPEALELFRFSEPTYYRLKGFTEPQLIDYARRMVNRSTGNSRRSGAGELIWPFVESSLRQFQRSSDGTIPPVQYRFFAQALHASGIREAQRAMSKGGVTQFLCNALKDEFLRAFGGKPDNPGDRRFIRDVLSALTVDGQRSSITSHSLGGLDRNRIILGLSHLERHGLVGRHVDAHGREHQTLEHEFLIPIVQEIIRGLTHWRNIVESRGQAFRQAKGFTSRLAVTLSVSELLSLAKSDERGLWVFRKQIIWFSVLSKLCHPTVLAGTASVIVTVMLMLGVYRKIERDRDTAILLASFIEDPSYKSSALTPTTERETLAILHLYRESSSIRELALLDLTGGPERFKRFVFRAAELTKALALGQSGGQQLLRNIFQKRCEGRLHSAEQLTGCAYIGLGAAVQSPQWKTLLLNGLNLYYMLEPNRAINLSTIVPLIEPHLNEADKAYVENRLKNAVHTNMDSALKATVEANVSQLSARINNLTIDYITMKRRVCDSDCQSFLSVLLEAARSGHPYVAYAVLAAVEVLAVSPNSKISRQFSDVFEKLLDHYVLWQVIFHTPNLSGMMAPEHRKHLLSVIEKKLAASLGEIEKSKDRFAAYSMFHRYRWLLVTYVRLAAASSDHAEQHQEVIRKHVYRAFNFQDGVDNDFNGAALVEQLQRARHLLSPAVREELKNVFVRWHTSRFYENGAGQGMLPSIWGTTSGAQHAPMFLSLGQILGFGKKAGDVLLDCLDERLKRQATQEIVAYHRRSRQALGTVLQLAPALADFLDTTVVAELKDYAFGVTLGTENTEMKPKALIPLASLWNRLSEAERMELLRRLEVYLDKRQVEGRSMQDHEDLRYLSAYISVTRKLSEPAAEDRLLARLKELHGGGAPFCSEVAGLIRPKTQDYAWMLLSSPLCSSRDMAILSARIEELGGPLLTVTSAGDAIVDPSKLFSNLFRRQSLQQKLDSYLPVISGSIEDYAERPLR